LVIIFFYFLFFHVFSVVGPRQQLARVTLAELRQGHPHQDLARGDLANLMRGLQEVACLANFRQGSTLPNLARDDLGSLRQGSLHYIPTMASLTQSWQGQRGATSLVVTLKNQKEKIYMKNK